MTDGQDIQRLPQWQLVLRSLSTLSYRAHDLSSYLHEITCAVSQLLKSDWSIVTIHQAGKGEIIASSLEMEGTETEFSIHESVSQVVVQSGRPFWIQDVKYHPETASQMAGYTCYLGIPLRILQGDVIGTICSFSKQPRQYDADVIANVELFAERAATAIDNYRLYQQQQQFNDLLEAEVSKRTTELREAQAKLIEHERLAAIGEFAAMIVHEIRNPLTTVQMGLQYFTKLDLPESAQIRLDLAMDESKRLAHLLQEILSYSKPQILQLAEIDVDAFIRELLILLRAMPEAQGRTIEYTPLNFPVQVLGDTNQLKQVFINLIRNACEAIEPAEQVQWSVSVVDDPAAYVHISVHNNGAPIPANVLPRLTQPFYSTKAEGTGLGLAIVKRIVEIHNGELLIESSELKGTTFSVKLPLKS